MTELINKLKVGVGGPKVETYGKMVDYQRVEIYGQMESDQEPDGEELPLDEETDTAREERELRLGSR